MYILWCNSVQLPFRKPLGPTRLISLARTQSFFLSLIIALQISHYLSPTSAVFDISLNSLQSQRKMMFQSNMLWTGLLAATALPAASAFPSFLSTRGYAATNANLYAYGANISGLPILYSVSDSKQN